MSYPKTLLVILTLLLVGCSAATSREGESVPPVPTTETRILVLELGDSPVNVEAATGVPEAEIFIKELDKRLITDAKGFATGDLPRGAYTFVVSKPGFLPATYVHGKVTEYHWPNVLWLSRNKALEVDLSKK